MPISIQWLGHAGFKITHESNIIYIDTWKLNNPAPDAENFKDNAPCHVSLLTPGATLNL